MTGLRSDWVTSSRRLRAGLGFPGRMPAKRPFAAREPSAGLEGDKTFHFGENAVLMRGPVDIDLETQPPPDLAIEVEVSHSADAALAAWGRLRVPEVWRFQPRSSRFTFCIRNSDGSYSDAERSLAFPALSPADVLEQLSRAIELGADRWNEQLDVWVREVILPRLDGGIMMGAVGAQRADGGFSSAPAFDALDSLSDELRLRVKSELEPGERLLWAAWSQPPFEHFGFGFFALGLVALIVLVLGAAGVIRANQSFRFSDGTDMALGMIFLAVSAVMIVGLFANWRWRMKQHQRRLARLLRDHRPACYCVDTRAQWERREDQDVPPRRSPQRGSHRDARRLGERALRKRARFSL